MNVDQIVSIESQVLVWLFVAIIVFLVLGFLRGLLRGWRYGTYRLIFYVVLIVIAFATLGAQANAISGFNIGQYYAGPIGFSINGTAISVPVTTLKETIQNAVIAVGQAIDLGSPDTLNALAQSLATSIIKLLMIVVDAIIIDIIGSLLILLLWHIGFKHIIPKSKRKASYKSGRLYSGFEEAVTVGILLTMFLTPFTSLISSVFHNFKEVSEEDEASVNVDGSTYNTVKQCLDAYDNSVFGKVFLGSYARNENNESFDQQLINFFTSDTMKTTASESKIAIGSVLGAVTKVASIALEGGLFDQKNMNSVGYMAFAASHYLPDLILALADSSFFTTIMPVGIDFVLSFPAVISFVKTNEGVDTSHTNWSDSLTNLASMVVDIQNAGILNSVHNTDPSNPNALGLNSDGIVTLFDDANVAKFDKVLDDLDSSSWSFLDKLISSALYVQACNSAETIQEAEKAGNPRGSTALAISDFLPAVDCTEDSSGNPAWDSDGDKVPDKVPTEFTDLHLGAEIKNLYHVIASLNKSLADAGSSNFVGNVATRLVTGTLMTDNYLTDLIFDYPKILETAIVGDLDATGELTNIDSETGKSTSSTVCLLDNTLLDYARPRLLTILSNTVSSTMGATVTGLDEAVAKVDTRLKFKGEVNSMFKIVNALVAPVNDDAGIGKAFIKHLDKKPGLNYDPDGKFNSIDPGLLTDLQNAVKAVDGSSVLTALIKGVFSSFLGNTLSNMMGEGWIDPVYPETGLGNELSKLLGLFGDCSGIIRYVTALSSSGSLTGATLDTVLSALADPKTGYQDQLTKLLEYAAESKILNPDTTVDGKKVSNTNFLLIINKALSSMGQEYTITQADLAASEWNAKDEADAFANCLVTLVSSGLISTLSNYTGSTLSISALAGVDFASIFKAVGDSVIMSKVFVKVLDSKVMPIIKSLSQTDLTDITFANVTDWELEGESLNSIVRFASEIGDFADIKYLDSDPTCVAQLLTTLSQSQMFIKTNKNTSGTITSKEYLFPKFFQDKFVASIKAGGPAAYFNDIGTTGTEANPYTYNALLQEFEKVAWLKDSDGNYLYYDSGSIYHKFDTTKWDAECSYFEEIVRRTEYIGGIDSFQSGADVSAINPTDYDALFKAVRHSQAFGKVLTYHLFEQALLALTAAGSALKGANLAYLWNCSPEQRAFETDCMAGLMYVVLDGKYGLVSASGALTAGNIKIDSASPEYCLYPMLSQIAESAVFNSLPDTTDDIPDTMAYSDQELTACEYQMFDLLKQAGFYLDNDGNVDEDKVKQQVKAIGHISGSVESEDGAAKSASDVTVAALIKAIKDSTLTSAQSDALSALGLSSSITGTTTVADATSLLVSACVSSTNQAYIRTLLGSGYDYVIDEGAREVWKSEAEALSTVGKKLQDFIDGDDKFSIKTFDVTKYYVNEYDDDVSGVKTPNATNITANDIAEKKVKDLLASVNAARLLYADLPNKISSALKAISTSIASFNTTLASTILALPTQSISTIRARNAGDPTTIYPYDYEASDTYDEIGSMANILRVGSVLIKIPNDTTHTVAKASQTALLSSLLASWTTAHALS